MYNLKSPQNLPDDIGNNTLIDILLEMWYKVIEGAIVHVLYKHKEGILVVVSEVVFDDVLGLAEIHDCYFLFDPFKEGGGVDWDYPYCVLFWFVAEGAGFVYFADAAFAFLAEEGELLGGIFLDKLDFGQFLFEFAGGEELPLEFRLEQFAAVIADDFNNFFILLLGPVWN